MPAPSPQEVAVARRILVGKDFVPQSLRFPLIILIIIVYMFSGGVYMSAVAEMTGTWAWINEDVMMAGYASMTGLTMAFPLLFRILFRYPTRELLLFRQDCSLYAIMCAWCATFCHLWSCFRLSVAFQDCRNICMLE